MAEPTPPAVPPGEGGQQPGDSSQQQPPGGSDDPKPPTSEKMYSKAEFDKVVGERQAAKESRRQADQRASELEDALKAMPSQDDLDAFKTWRADQDTAARDKALKEGDADSLVKKARAPLEKQVEALTTKLESREGQLTALLRDQALKIAAVAAGAIIPDQVVALLRPRVQMEEQADGRFVPKFFDADGQQAYDAKGPVTDVQEFVGQFLALPECANLVRTTAKPGSGAQPSGGGDQPTAPEGVPKTLEELEALPLEQAKEALAKMTPEQRQALAPGTKVETAGYL